MTDFYNSSLDQQRMAYSKLGHEALKRWDMLGASLKLLKQRENAVFCVSTPQGEKFAMRIHRAYYHTDIEVLSELQWMQALDEYGVCTPSVVPSSDNKLFEIVSIDSVPEPRQVDLFEWIDGEAMGSIEAGVSGNVEQLVSNYRLLGALAASIHNQAASWTFPQGFTRHKWNSEGLVGDDPVWGRGWENPALTAAQRDLLLAARQVVHEKLAEFGTGSDRYGLIHADFLPENVMVCRDELKLIDFDDCGYGWHLFELAIFALLHNGKTIQLLGLAANA